MLFQEATYATPLRGSVPAEDAEVVNFEFECSVKAVLSDWAFLAGGTSLGDVAIFVPSFREKDVGVHPFACCVFDPGRVRVPFHFDTFRISVAPLKGATTGLSF
jgi:hypothetical protein